MTGGGGWDGFGGRGREFGDGHNPGELLRMGIMRERMRVQGMTSRGNFEDERRTSSQNYLEEFRRLNNLGSFMYGKCSMIMRKI